MRAPHPDRSSQAVAQQRTVRTVAKVGSSCAGRDDWGECDLDRARSPQTSPQAAVQDAESELKSEWESDTARSPHADCDTDGPRGRDDFSPKAEGSPATSVYTSRSSTPMRNHSPVPDQAEQQRTPASPFAVAEQARYVASPHQPPPYAMSGGRDDSGECDRARSPQSRHLPRTFSQAAVQDAESESESEWESDTALSSHADCDTDGPRGRDDFSPKAEGSPATSVYTSQRSTPMRNHSHVLDQAEQQRMPASPFAVAEQARYVASPHQPWPPYAMSGGYASQTYRGQVSMGGKVLEPMVGPAINPFAQHPIHYTSEQRAAYQMYYQLQQAYRRGFARLHDRQVGHQMPLPHVPHMPHMQPHPYEPGYAPQPYEPWYARTQCRPDMVMVGGIPYQKSQNQQKRWSEEQDGRGKRARVDGKTAPASGEELVGQHSAGSHISGLDPHRVAACTAGTVRQESKPPLPPPTSSHKTAVKRWHANNAGAYHLDDAFACQQIKVEPGASTASQASAASHPKHEAAAFSRDTPHLQACAQDAMHPRGTCAVARSCRRTVQCVLAS